jgi:hypothetical protein
MTDDRLEYGSQVKPGSFSQIAVWACRLIILASVIAAWQEFYHLATTSLWQDELFSIARYSAKGVLFTATHYEAPNNHIFFNLLNATIPGDFRFVPIRARVWSFLFVAGTFLLVIVYQARRQRLFEGALLGYLLAGNLGMLDLLLQARGYSITAFSALCSTLLTCEYFRRPRTLPVVGLSILAWVGTWAVPTFVLFAAPLFLVGLLLSRDWRWLVSGSVAGLLIFLSYLPVAGELIRNSQSFAAQWGKEFGTWQGISDLFATYLFFHASPWLSFLLTTAVLIAFFSDWVRTDPAERACYCVVISTTIALAAALKLQTPFVRTLAFLVLPFGFVIVTTGARYLHKLRREIQGYAIFSVAAAVFAAAVFQACAFSFTPIEAWKETAGAVEARFPKGTEIVASFRPEWLRVYLDTDYRIGSKFDRPAFLQGRQIIVDSAFWAKDRFPVKELPAGYATLRVPQRRGEYQRIYYWPPQ